MSEGNFLWLLILTLGQVMAVVSSIYSMRRKPPLAEELYADFARTRDIEQIIDRWDRELAELRAHEEKVHAEVFAQIRNASASHQADFKTLERAMGRIEGILQEMKRQ